MYPVLFKFGKISIYTYGVLIALGFLAGVFLVRKEAKRLEENPDKMMDLCFYLLIAAIIGSRLFYVATTPEMFLSDPLEFFRIWNGGLVFYGGFLGALAAAVVYLRFHRMNLWKTTDILAPSAALGQFFGRLGCFFAGCCYGKSCSSLPWAMTFTHPGSLAPLHVPLHPSQLYHAAGNLIIFLLLWRHRHRKSFDGQLFWAYVLMYGITRGFLEIFRGDYRGTIFFDVLSISQVIGGLMALAAVIALFLLGKKKPPAHPTP